MKTISIIIGIITGLMLISTLICGLWIRSNKITDVTSIDFHFKLGTASVILSIITIVTLLIHIIKK